MYIFDDHYYKLNQQLLRFLGLWPYKKTKFERFRAMCFYVLIASYLILQFGQLIVADLNINVVVKILSEALPAFASLVMFNMFFFDAKGLRQMLDEIINNWRMLTDAQEIKIAEHYAQQGKYATIVVMSLLIFFGPLFLIITLLPDILDFFRPLNESRVHYLAMMNEYHINQGIQFYSLFLYSNISNGIGVLAFLAVSFMLLSIALHCCAIFKICSYRIKQSVDKKILTCFIEKNVIIERMIRTVELHRNAHKLLQLLSSTFMISFIIILMGGTCSLITSLYRFMLAIRCMDNLIELILAIIFVLAHEIYLFASTFVGQRIVNHANELFNAIYMSLWYKAPLTVQKSFLFIMQISSKGFVPLVGGIYVSVLESFTSVTNTAVSFMMIMYSLQ